MVSEEVRKAIDKVNLRFSEGFPKGDASITANVYTEDAVICPPNSEMIRGRKAIEEFWDGVMKMGVKEAVLTTVELSGSGNTLHELGKGILKIHPEGQEPVEQKVKYVVVWKHTADGWKYQWDIWNSSMPPQQ
jgi:uncharacterized protein (TIGR02246 family)